MTGGSPHDAGAAAHLQHELRRLERERDALRQAAPSPAFVWVAPIAFVAISWMLALVVYATLGGASLVTGEVDRYDAVVVRSGSDALPVLTACEVVVTPGSGGCELEMECDGGYAQVGTGGCSVAADDAGGPRVSQAMLSGDRGSIELGGGVLRLGEGDGAVELLTTRYERATGSLW